MKASILVSIARQVQGEFCFVNIIKASTDSDKIQKFLEENPLPRTEVIGEVDCVIEYGIFKDIEIDDI